MRIHRSARKRYFTVLGNEVLRDSRLSYCARGILAHLLSQPDGKREDIRTLAEHTPEGRERVAAAMRELERFGYLKRTKKRTTEGQIYTELDVFDTLDRPSDQVTPDAGFPGSGDSASGSDGDHPVEERDDEPNLPPPPDTDVEAGREDVDDEEMNASAALLARVGRAEPRLALGEVEALRLAPLVVQWRRRGATELHVINALTVGLPRGGVYHPVRFIETRLRSKMPAERRLVRAQLECDECQAPVTAAGLCRSCQEPAVARDRGPVDFDQVRVRGAALARAALRGLSIDGVAPVLG